LRPSIMLVNVLVNVLVNLLLILLRRAKSIE